VLDDVDAGAEGHGGSDDRIANNENLTEKLSQDYQFHLRSGKAVDSKIESAGLVHGRVWGDNN